MTIIGSLGDPPQDAMAAIRGTFRDGGSVLLSAGSAVAIHGYLDSAEADRQRPWKCGRAIVYPARRPSTEANGESTETLLTCVTNSEST